MIPKVITARGSTRRLIAYLYGPGRANEHTDPHLVASWNDFAPDPGRTSDRDPKQVEKQLAGQLDQPVTMLGQRAPEVTVWHCPVRTAPEDPILTDAQWAAVARRMVAAAGLAPAGDEEACRWVAVRHADDHIHIAATLVRQDGRRARRDHDLRAVQREARKIEIEYELRRLKPGDGTGAKRPTSKEHFKAKRQGHDTTTRDILRLKVRRAMAAAATEAEFFALLDATGVTVRPKTAPSGDVTGYSVALPGDTTKDNLPVWYSGSTLAADLSLPQIRQRLTTTAPEPATVRPGNAWHQATAATERIPHHLTHSPDPTAQAQMAVLGEALDVLPLMTSGAARVQLQQAATLFERATRSRTAADHTSSRALRRSIQTILRSRPADRDGSGLAMLLDVALIAVAYAMHWHRTHHHAQQEAAAEQALTHLQAAYEQTAEPVLAGLARQAPAQQTENRYAHHLHRVIPEHADRILNDPAFDALAAALTAAETAGHDVATLLDQTANQRTLADTRSPARTLTWRIHRHAQRRATSPRAQAARTRSTRIPAPITSPTREILPERPRQLRPQGR